VITIDGYSRSLNTQQPGCSRPTFSSHPFRAGGRTWHVIPWGARGGQRTPTPSLSISFSTTSSSPATRRRCSPRPRSVCSTNAAESRCTPRPPQNVFSAARRVWGYERFIKRRDLEQSSGILKDDRFAIRVQVHLKKEAPFVAVPPPDIRRHIGDLLMSGSKEEAATDVEFLVGGGRRSPRTGWSSEPGRRSSGRSSSAP